MCGITGIMAFNEIGRMHMIQLAKSTESLMHRGPDAQNNYIAERTALGHRRLAVLDPSPLGNQPMTDASGRYCIVYNGEIYNYRELRQDLQNKGITFASDSDTEVLLYLYITHGEECLRLLNGCFAFAIYDARQDELFLARDRFGINPLLYYSDQDKFVFGSEMRSLLAYNIPKHLDYESLNLFLELNYVPAPASMLKDVKKLLPGSYMRVSSSSITVHRYYDIPEEPLDQQPVSYDQQKIRLLSLVEEAVSRRMIADVPLGAFLSGGIDSSVVVAMASRHSEKLNTFSIGFKQQPYFDESQYAQLVAKKFNTRHTVFDLGIRELYQHLMDLWEHLDEPFADSSALPSYILSKYTRGHVTVALSGDGADELFGGYNKHLALDKSLRGGMANFFIASIAPFTKILPRSRNGAIANKIRQLDRMARGLDLDVHDRYWYWASISGKEEALATLGAESLVSLNLEAVKKRRQELMSTLGSSPGLNDFLRTDLQLVLPNDMLAKVDWMSMAHGLEVRVPFLDHELVNYVCTLPAQTKINGGSRKLILRDTFKEILPRELYNRPKKGFEVPLLNWMRSDLQGVINKELLNEKVLHDQGIFDISYVEKLKKQLLGRNPNDTPARLWALLVFQKWWLKYLS